MKHSPNIRTWGTRFDPLPSSPPPSPTISLPPINKKDEKVPHDASIFVGSLPSNLEKQELVRLLSGHLSEYAHIKNIKVVRDSKGGLCAFVQCDDPAAATRLIQTLHSSEPKPFLGRHLRYEPARASRTLLISYRTPIQFVQSSTVDPEPTNMGMKQEAVELELPTSMTLCRPWKAKYSSIFYNTALDAENHPETAPGQQNAVLSHNGSTLYLNPLVCDAETVRKLSSHFGSLEHFGLYHPDGISLSVSGQSPAKEIVSSDYPAPHDAPRSFGMDPACWEVKWDHRDDCVSALMTLRRVPHLTVTWAHQPTSSGFQYYSPVMPHQSLRFLQPNTPIYPYEHVHDHVQPHENVTPPITTCALSSELTPSHSDGTLLSSIKSSSAQDSELSDLTTFGSSLSLDAKSPPSEQNTISLDSIEERVDKLLGAKTSEWTEIDFPPLGDTRNRRKQQGVVWVEKGASKIDGYPERPLSSPHMATISEGTSDLPEAACQSEEQELDLPPTPELGMSPITPKTPGSAFPDTPTGYVSDFQTLTLNDKDGKDNMACMTGVDRELDPTTIFVGGLEMFGPNAWDEQKIHDFFGKFGVVENVKFVRPVNGRSAFAFVKFNDTEASARAVLEQHNRIHDGRQMRVQIRDCNPPHRSAWKYGRGRGKYSIQRQYGELEDRTPSIGGRVSTDHSRDLSTAGTVGDSTSVAVTEFPTLNNDPVELATYLDHPSTDEGPFGTVHVRGHELHVTQSHRSSPEPTARGVSSQSGDFRDWHEDPAQTGPPSSFGSSATATATPPFLPYPVPNQGFYPPQPWMQPVPQPFPYPVPYMPGYPGFAIPPQHSFQNPATSDACGPTAGIQNAWGPMYAPYMSYPGYPANVPSMDQTQGQQSSSQAPLLPTGFIHGEQGTLMPVYHPDALEQYMSALRPGAHPQPPPYPFQVPNLPPQGLQGNQGPAQPGVNMSWNSGQPSAVPLQHQQQLDTAPVPFAPLRQPTPVVPRGGYIEKSSHQRRSHRRDYQGILNTNRQSHTRGHPNRYSRGGGAQHSTNADQAASQLSATPPLFNSIPGDWTKWSTGR